MSDRQIDAHYMSASQVLRLVILYASLETPDRFLFSWLFLCNKVGVRITGVIVGGISAPHFNSLTKWGTKIPPTNIL